MGEGVLGVAAGALLGLCGWAFGLLFSLTMLVSDWPDRRSEAKSIEIQLDWRRASLGTVADHIHTLLIDLVKYGVAFSNGRSRSHVCPG